MWLLAQVALSPFHTQLITWLFADAVGLRLRQTRAISRLRQLRTEKTRTKNEGGRYIIAPQRRLSLDPQKNEKHRTLRLEQ